MNKAFSQKLHDENDSIAKKITEEIMRDYYSALLVRDNNLEGTTFKDGCWDQMYRKNSVVKIVESEMKHEKFWDLDSKKHTSCSYPFLYNTMDIPARKKKNKANYFLVISTGKNLAFGVMRKTLNDYGKDKNKKTIYEKEGGDYISIDVKYGTFFEKVDGKWFKYKR